MNTLAARSINMKVLLNYKSFCFSIISISNFLLTWIAPRRNINRGRAYFRLIKIGAKIGS